MNELPDEIYRWCSRCQVMQKLEEHDHLSCPTCAGDLGETKFRACDLRENPFLTAYSWTETHSRKSRSDH